MGQQKVVHWVVKTVVLLAGLKGRWLVDLRVVHLVAKKAAQKAASLVDVRVVLMAEHLVVYWVA